MTIRSLSLRLTAALLALGWATQVQASTGYTIPDNITVNTPTDISIDQRVEPDSELRQRFHAYRVFLAVEPPGWGLGPICWLADAVDLDKHDISIYVPADVVPDNTRVQISTGLVYDRNPQRVNGYDYSGYTRIVGGGNGTWIQRELDGWVIGDENLVSCWALGCVRNCQDKYYTGDESRISDGSGDGEADKCADQCIKDLNPKRRSGASKRTQASLAGATLMSAVLILISV